VDPMDFEKYGRGITKYGDYQEISLREELVELITGDDFGEEKFIPHVLRKIRIDNKQNKIRCTCWDPISNEGRQGCPFCDGIGSLWDESIVAGFMYFLTKKKLSNTEVYSNQPGRSEKYDLAFISPSDLRLREGDRIYIPSVTEEGFFVIPLYMESEFFVINYTDFRLGNGRVEYSRSVLSKVR
jgi:hypothetical protein